MQCYATDLRSITAGRGFYEMQYDHYAPVSPNLMQPIVTKHKAGTVEEE